MPIKAWLRGDSFDLGMLAELFPASDDPSVSVDSEGYYLTSASLDDDLTADANAMYERASSLLRDVNGAARLMRSDFRPVELTGRFSDPAENVHVVGLTDTIMVRAHLRASAVVVGPGVAAESEPTQSAAQGYVQLVAKHTDVQDVLALLGKSEPPDWIDLYKIYEIVGDQVAGGPKGREKALAATGWVTPGDLDAFKMSANHQGVSGDAARHARMSGSPRQHPMTIEDARQMIRVLVSGWFDSL
jgi:hypothetical protein